MRIYQGPARAVPMGAFEHLKTLCCLGLPAESAMIAVTPLLHEIIPHGAIRTILFESDASVCAVAGTVSEANGSAERRASEAMLKKKAKSSRSYLEEAAKSGE